MVSRILLICYFSTRHTYLISDEKIILIYTYIDVIFYNYNYISRFLFLWNILLNKKNAIIQILLYRVIQKNLMKCHIYQRILGRLSLYQKLSRSLVFEFK